MAKKCVGPKGQILIPKPMREAIGIKPGVDVVIELRDDEIIINKPNSEGNYTEYYPSTSSPKIKKNVNIKELILEEVSDRHALPSFQRFNKTQKRPSVDHPGSGAPPQLPQLPHIFPTAKKNLKPP